MALLEVPHAGGDGLELRIAVRMLAAFARLARPLQAVVGFMEQIAHHLRADLMPLRPQLRSEPPHALARPAQRRLWIPPCGRLHQRFEIREQGRVVLDSPLAASASAAAPPLAAAWYGRRLTTQLLDTRLDRRPRQACRLGHHTDSAASQPHGLRRRPQPPSRLVQDRAQRLELFGDWQVIFHGLDYTTETLLVKFISRRFLKCTRLPYKYRSSTSVEGTKDSEEVKRHDIRNRDMATIPRQCGY